MPSIAVLGIAIWLAASVTAEVGDAGAVQGKPETSGGAVVEAEQGERAQQQPRRKPAEQQARTERQGRIPALLAERTRPPNEEREHVLAFGQDDGRAHGRGEQGDDHAREHHRQRFEPAPPAQPEHQRDGADRPGERDALARDGDRRRGKGGREGQCQLRARDDAERRSVGDRVAQDALQQEAG
jgi:hypothetical protein